MGRTVWFLTGNLGKVKEATHHLQPLGYDVKQLIVPEGTITEPQADSLTEVAMAKIEQAIPHMTNPEDLLLVEDAGLFVDALDGFPGVYAAYALHTIGCPGMLRLLNHLGSEDPVQSANLRSASFQAVAVMWSNGQVLIGNGRCPGWIANEMTEGEGFGFDPVFVPSDLDEHGEPLPAGQYGAISTHGASFGAISIEEKQKFSHRTRALEDLLRQLPSA
jgi:XTP/dITP diphosphohydrolase